MRPQVCGVLFDFDGTLTLPGSLDFPGIKRLIGCPPDTPILEYLETQPGFRRARLTEILEHQEAMAARRSRPNRGAEACLVQLTANAIPVGILTRNSLASVEAALGLFNGIGVQDFAAVITREQCPPKPSPDGVVLAARRMGVPPRELMVVGDFRFDVLAGRGAGAVTVLLTNAKPSPMEPGDPAPDFVISHLEELSALLGLPGMAGMEGANGAPPAG